MARNEKTKAAMNSAVAAALPRDYQYQKGAKRSVSDYKDRAAAQQRDLQAYKDLLKAESTQLNTQTDQTAPLWSTLIKAGQGMAQGTSVLDGLNKGLGAFSDYGSELSRYQGELEARGITDLNDQLAIAQRAEDLYNTDMERDAGRRSEIAQYSDRAAQLRASGVINDADMARIIAQDGDTSGVVMGKSYADQRGDAQLAMDRERLQWQREDAKAMREARAEERAAKAAEKAAKAAKNDPNAFNSNVYDAGKAMIDASDTVTNQNVTDVGGWSSYLPTAIPSTVDSEQLFNQLGGQTFLSAYQSLKGGGAITEKEGAKANAALNRLIDPKTGQLRDGQSEDSIRQGLADIRSAGLFAVGVETFKSQNGRAPNPMERNALLQEAEMQSNTWKVEHFGDTRPTARTTKSGISWSERGYGAKRPDNISD